MLSARSTTLPLMWRGVCSILLDLIVRYETRDSGVICKLHHHVCGLSSRAVMSEQGEEGGAERTPLRCASVHCGQCG